MYSEENDFIEKSAACKSLLTSISPYFENKDISLALELGGEGGVLSGLLTQTFNRGICTDIVNVNSHYGGEFAKLLREKFKRNGFDLDLGKIEFHTADAQNLIYGNEKFDLVFSLNAFEHIPDPLKAIDEAHRVLRPKGVFYASFDPVWSADSGNHFMNYVNEPWLHLLVSDKEFRKKMASAGAAEWEVRQYPQQMNRLPARFYKTQFKQRLTSLFSIVEMEEWSGCVSEEYVEHINRRKAAEKNGWNPSELLIRGFKFVAVK
ncbi:MAG TPA: class I SAM-dependent methyltransferase [Accumulibacter sp.]|nr:class I SAM-dependent methyltransferase [Accumulibacter sp.]HNG37486.1 class I SAM-dependent methyltransferase [Accumulibacter sp.]HNL12441.1 class I SAM-dependent methyltransferase [Accumulibacter sp.]HNL76381.1 class I SAM-dependent methyltransferase [Accumulibacter sp.]HNM74103.1 class I SAM-dependent methyltransferase [Accumulibacter sp.]